MRLPGFTAEASCYSPENFGAKFDESRNEPNLIEPAMPKICSRLASASWDAYESGDFRGSGFIEGIMELVGCFD
jgi:hypothetical protein